MRSRSYFTGPLLRAMAVVLACGNALPVAAQSAPYDPHATFAPFSMDTPPGPVRSASGVPGEHYWQNRADYAIHAELDENGPQLSASEDITYTNNSPDALDLLWIQLDQNIYRNDSRDTFASDGIRSASTQGFVIESVEVLSKGRFVAVHTLVNDTRMRVNLPEALAPKGGKAILRIKYRFAIPGKGGDRMSWGKAQGGAIYDMAQWYPRMAVYDDLRGWDTLPYIGQEFYLEYGDFDYWVSVPSTMLVAGSGELINPQQVLTPAQNARLAKARTSDATVMIRAPGEINDPSSRPGQSGRLTWHFHMKDTRDVAFSASSVFAWDAARINLPGGRTSLAMSFYPAESQGNDRWGRSTEYVKDTVERMSQRWYSYPWPAAINVAGPSSGIEYPGIVFDGIDDAGKTLFWITAHEIGHSWFPMIVGFDERRNAWMDEGFNTFIDTFESDDFNKGEYGPKRDSEFAPHGGNPVDEILPVLADAAAPPILSRADTITETYRHPITYFKSALGLKLLREEILGPERFDPAFRSFIAAWAFRHPKPSDFFRAMESAGGEDLGWWWRGWYANNWSLDLGIEGIGYVEGDAAKGTQITVGSHDRLVMPVTLRVDLADGSHRDYHLPAESWIRQTATNVVVPAGQQVIKATLDPEHRLPDRNRQNDVFAVTR